MIRWMQSRPLRSQLLLGLLCGSLWCAWYFDPPAWLARVPNGASFATDFPAVLMVFGLTLLRGERINWDIHRTAGETRFQRAAIAVSMVAGLVIVIAWTTMTTAFFVRGLDDLTLIFRWDLLLAICAILYGMSDTKVGGAVKPDGTA